MDVREREREERNEKLNNLYNSLNIISVVVSMRIRWAAHRARISEMINGYKILF